jgi:transcriptional regulator with GAF, ATPase, and Fis domain
LTVAETQIAQEIVSPDPESRGGRRNAAARFLQNTQRIINYRIRQLGIDPKAYR